jgi:hypothetical protein
LIIDNLQPLRFYAAALPLILRKMAKNRCDVLTTIDLKYGGLLVLSKDWEENVNPCPYDKWSMSIQKVNYNCEIYHAALR